ncbi:oxidoreductase [Terricaulis silvestris]|uniref:Oxidoreductase YdbC n=1 Tax=Terricaulis silvestris TaxID=2686094 RepID=A0A6I6MIV6_9CAUL|nr:oxidoreductase [Terricaulis silvestris]QGZ93721.1 Putative oxidoreductase YdbC [Terricaulis silvestris]
MVDVDAAGTFMLGDNMVNRLGYGAMQLTGPGVFGPPANKAVALAVLREAIARGVNHIDTADFYGPHVTNQLIREALHPYPRDLVIVTKVGAKRRPTGSVHAATSRSELIAAVHDNLRNLALNVLEVVNFRSMYGNSAPREGSVEEPLTVLAELQAQGLIRHIGLSNVTPAQVSEGRTIAKIVGVQNLYNLADRTDDALVKALAREKIAYVAYFPLGGFSKIKSATLSRIATRIGATPMQVAIAWLLQRSPNILPIPGTSSLAHLDENIAAASLRLSPDVIAELDAIVPSA